MNMSRRQVIVGGAAVAAVSGVAAWKVPMSGRGFDAVRQEMATPLSGIADLVRHATLAANGHNTQAWRFQPTGRSIRILPDFDRGTPVVDPDHHHVYASLGCAAENLSLAARAAGFSGEVLAQGGAGLEVALEPGPAETTPLFDAIPERRSTRALYDGQPAPAEVTARLVETAGAVGVEAVHFAPDRQEPLVELVVSGNAAQMADPGFRAELKSWLRFNPRAAARTRDGLFSAGSGNPVLPSWLGPVMYDLFFDAEAENAKYAAQMRSSAGTLVLLAPGDDPAGWAAAGRAAERVMLQAAVDGLKVAFVNQAVEDPPSRQALMALIGTDRRPSLVLRYGRGPDMPPSLRRPVSAVMSEAA